MKTNRPDLAACCDSAKSDVRERTMALLGDTRSIGAEDKTRRSWVVRLSRTLVLKQLAAIRRGTITIHDGDEILQFGQPDTDGLHAEIHVNDHAAYPMIAGNGSIGSGEAYIHGFWTTPELTAVTKIFVRNLD
ncbi:MAG: cyclopropane-fatty-acyl-phospholipid synthase, partial [Halopseudomonas sp.]